MTVSIYRLSSAKAWDLIFPECAATLTLIECETIERTIMNSSQLWIGLDEDKVLAVWGLIPPTLMSDTAYLWLHTTKHLVGHSFLLVRHSQRIIQAMLLDYPIICGHAKFGASRSIQWLRWLGAEFADPIDNKVIPFTIKAKQWQQDSAQSA